MDSLATVISTSLFGLKTEMGTLARLIHDWALTVEGEQERKVRIRALNTIIGLHGDRLPAADRKDAHDHLEALLHLSEFYAVSSVGYREKMQAQIKDQLERLTGQVDLVISQVNKLLEQLDGPAGATHDSSGIIFVQEEERKRISREIHDGPAQTLANLTMRLDFALELLPKPLQLKTELLEMKESLIRSMQDIRRFIFDLRPMAIDDLGLVPTLEQFLSGVRNRTEMGIDLTVDGPRQSLSPEKELTVFRVIQEAINNALRHSQAKGVTIHLCFIPEKDILSGSIRDNGVGFDAENLRKIYPTLRKLGLTSMEERIRAVNGRFELLSAPGEGTEVTFSVPLDPGQGGVQP